MNAPKELLRPVQLGGSAALRGGQQVLVLGNPFGEPQLQAGGGGGGGRGMPGHIMQVGARPSLQGPVPALVKPARRL